MAKHFAMDLRLLKGRNRRTTCALTILIDGNAVWPVWGESAVSLEVQLDDLLAHLTEFWKPLMLRQVYPIDVSPMRPSDLRREAERRWAELQASVVEAEEQVVRDFEEAHNLASAFAGIYGLPPFWILRSGDHIVLETNGALRRAPFKEVYSALSAVGEQICEHLKGADLERWSAAISAWNERGAGEEGELLAWSTGLTHKLAGALIKEGTLDAPRDFEDAANDDDELRIAARMAGALPTNQIREVLQLARQFGRQDAHQLRSLAYSCMAFISERYDYAAPFQQGEAAARFVRQQLNLPSDEPVRIFEIASQVGIELRHTSAEPPTLDGLAIWGKRHGPGVFLNESSSRILGRGESEIADSLGACVTLAHELCHLLLDGGQAITAIEVLKARMPPGVEQRAKSFAGEFLFPTQAAARHWRNASRPSNRTALNALVENMMGVYRVTRSVAAWKIEHAAREYNVDLGAELDAVAPRR